MIAERFASEKNNLLPGRQTHPNPYIRVPAAMSNPF